jgi:hypothetical protein
MGEDWKQEFSQEELVALGEAEAPKPDEKPQEQKQDEKPAQPAPEKPVDDGGKPPEKPESEQKPEEAQATPEETAAAEKMGFRIETDAKGRQYIVDDDGTRIPPVKWKKLYFESHERGRQLDNEKRKNDLLKQLGRDEYFRMYPDEAPQGWKPKEAPRQQTEVLPLGDPRVLDMQISGGAYHGSTLRDVMTTDPESGMAIYNNYAAGVLEKAGKQRQAEAQTQQEIVSAVQSFGSNRAKELFGLDDPTKMTPDQAKTINEVGFEVMAWMKLNKKEHLDFEDAYRLMNHDKIIAKAKEEGAANALKGLQKTAVLPAIGGGAHVTTWRGISTGLMTRKRQSS